MSIPHLGLLAKATCKNSAKTMNRFSFALIIPLAHQDFQQYQNTFALQ